MPTRILSLLAALVMAGFSGFARGADAQEAGAAKPQTTCPIRGGAVNKDVFVDYAGKRIYFCCPGCDKAFLKDADALIKKMEDAGITLEAAPVAEKPAAAAAAEPTLCPVSHEPIDTDIFVVHDGQKVFFCCKMCRGKFNKNPENYLKNPQGAVDGEPAPAAAAPTPAGHDHGAHAHH